jgi:hypothetical protein
LVTGMADKGHRQLARRPNNPSRTVSSAQVRRPPIEKVLGRKGFDPLVAVDGIRDAAEVGEIGALDDQPATGLPGGETVGGDAGVDAIGDP